ncbi:2,5-didehydrogluconate reductase DkgB [Bdellovibrio bacteriovorus]|uniref:2,5-didehydrogluconate reductase B n=1 Tax=Bdellovibrio bacteriovorus TaxID=959 RepID=A0A1Z3N492_BDEBC|nr:2,5-didehydrogluconate reductase DkgB [Bdellovibrio bacteriovorus]ASD62293.1 2,5-didehydrogluconate reductase B [Bdellovibrio bacteriovorus]
MKMPQIGLGTFRLKGADAENSVRMGLELGYRHIDTAQIYDNETEVGKVLTESGIPRADVFLTTKIWTENLSKASLIPSLKESLQKLQTDYVDLVLIHWPSPEGKVPLAETLEALMQAKSLGLSKEIGVSNFPISEMKKAVEIVGAKNIFTNQIEVHPYLQNRKLVDYLQSVGVTVTAYMPLAYGKVMKDETLLKIASRHGMTPADVVLSWLMDQEMVVIPSSTKKQNLQARRGLLTAEEKELIASLNSGERLANPAFAPAWD